MGVAVHPGRPYDVQARGLGDVEQAFGVTTQADRCPVDDSPDANGNQREGFHGGQADVGELVPRLYRGRQEKVLVSVRRAQLTGLQIAADSAYH